MPDPTDVILHIGTGKTGTTTIQHLMRLSRAALAEVGVLYPTSPGPVRHTKFGLSFRTDDDLEKMPAWRRMKAQSPEKFRRRVQRRLLAEIAEAALPRVLFSDEALYGFSGVPLERLRDFTDGLGGQVRIVVYLRRQDDHLISYYQQQVKVGETSRLADWSTRDRSSTYDYARRLAHWRTEMNHAALVVRRFEPRAFLDGSLEADFLAAAGIEGVPATPVERRNESLDAEAVEFLRVYNLYLAEHQGQTGQSVERHALVNRLVDRLGEHPAGPALTLPPALLDTFMETWEATNRTVAREHFGDDLLFSDDRRSARTTDEQMLDPDRIDHYCELAELPAGARDDLHRIAVREAARS
ncbi:hypothetical protein F0U44_08410 [Nocardioides humilatus]|uniref:Sulfotransferase family protein n=1 Tax=Nocardioides humilatus TaxID=2607660 RepID=A0A5B1LD04_9ACTN|nr:hypothetical protein [Nocardioides humilatus]KAA1418522.1 hypothetical protein F0U44_08410 [Nocardioides humilatus]